MHEFRPGMKVRHKGGSSRNEGVVVSRAEGLKAWGIDTPATPERVWVVMAPDNKPRHWNPDLLERVLPTLPVYEDFS